MFATAVLSILLSLPSGKLNLSHAQEQTASAEDAAAQSPEPLSADEMEVLVARIALYPDDLVALICGASLYPLQIVQASRFLDDYEEDSSLQPKEDWDGSVVSLLNYPEIVRMMSDDLDWTQALADALAYQQQDVLVAIQQLREEAVAGGIIQTDDKMEVVEENDNVVIKPASPEVIYVPQYDPQILYVPDYPPAPVAYYPNPYPYYYSPTATFFAGAVTGAIWASAIDWNGWGVWGGSWRGGNIDIDCNNCFNNRNFSGKVNINDVDWKNVDRSKISVDRDQFAKIDRTKIKNDIEKNRNNSIGNKAASIKKERPSTLPADRGGSRDVRKSMQEGLKKGPGDLASVRPGGERPARPNVERPKVSPPKVDRPKVEKPAAKLPDKASRPKVDRPKVEKPIAKLPDKASRPKVDRPAAKKPKQASRPAGGKKPKQASRPSGGKKPGAKVDKRPSKPSGLGNVSKGKPQKVASNRGSKSMGGGSRGGGGKHKSVKRGGGKRR